MTNPPLLPTQPFLSPRSNRSNEARRLVATTLGLSASPGDTKGREAVALVPAHQGPVAAGALHCDTRSLLLASFMHLFHAIQLIGCSIP